MADIEVGTPVLDQDYIELALSLPCIRLAIMGIDPYPTRPTGIAFCRRTWKEMLSRASAGLFVLESLGVDVYEVSDETGSYRTPRDYFIYLAEEHGIVFINASNHFARARLNKDTEAYFMEAGLCNLLIIEQAQVTLLCGDIPQKLYGAADKTVACLHPSQNWPEFRRHWLETWAPNRLKKQFRLDLDRSGSVYRMIDMERHLP
jgi:hypothetical protein